MIAHPAPRHHALPRPDPAAPPRLDPMLDCPALGLPPATDEIHGWVGYESARPRAWLTAFPITDVAQVPT